jgi:hypothetical protein
MADTTTTFGMTIKNYTRYNTEDLLALANRWEKTLLDNGHRSLATLKPPVIRPDHPNDGKIIFRDYSPTHPFTERRVWSGHRSEVVRERNYAYTHTNYSSDGGEIAIILPGKIYVDPIEALTSMSADEPQIPFDMFKTLWRRISDMYLAERRDEAVRKLNERSVPTDLAVRLSEKRGAKRPKADGITVAREKLRSKLWTVVYYQERSVKEIERAIRGMVIANRHATRGEMPTLDEDRLRALLVELRDMTSTSRKYREHLMQVVPVS